MTSRQTLDLLRAHESRNITFMEPDGSWPIVWERAKGMHVWDAEGKKYLDLTAAFGVAACGHANPRVVQAGQKQMGRLLHAMGDVHPHALKAQLAAELSRITFERWEDESKVQSPKSKAQCPKLEGRRPKSEDRSSAIPQFLVGPPRRGGRVQALSAKAPYHSRLFAALSAKAPYRTEGLRSVAGGAGSGRGKVIFCSSGFEAVEAALKTAMLATRKPGIIAFEGGYHGLGYGALNATHRSHFRSPFRSQLREFGCFVPFPIRPSELGLLEKTIRRLFKRQRIGAVLVEPIQVRGGINIPPPGFLPMLRRLCDDFEAVLILDEIYTGFGRTGKWFACEHSATVPDVICLGKALTGGFPLSACVGRADLMDAAWPPSDGEAIHTSTFLGHPVGCAMALAQIREIRGKQLDRRSATLGKYLFNQLAELESSASAERTGCSAQARGLGLLAGLELRQADGQPATQVALDVIKTLLHRGIILLPEGEFSNVISFSPPLIISREQVDDTVAALKKALQA